MPSGNADDGEATMDASEIHRTPAENVTSRHLLSGADSADSSPSNAE